MDLEANEKMAKKSLLAHAQGLLESTRGLYVILALSFAFKISLFLMTDIISNDGPRYINQSIQFLEGNFYAAIEGDFTFLYSLLIATLGYTGLDLVLAAQGISLFASVLILIPLYCLFKEMANARVAFWGCLAFTLSPKLNKFSVSVMRDPLFLLIFALFVFFAWRALERKKIIYFALASFFSVVVPFLRVEGLLGLPVFLTFLLARFLSKTGDKRLLIPGLVVFLIPIMILVSACIFYPNLQNSYNKRSRQVESVFDSVIEGSLFSRNSLLKHELNKIENAIPNGSLKNDFAEIASQNIEFIYLIGLISLISQDLWFPFFVIFIIGTWRLQALAAKGLLFYLTLNFSFLILAYYYNQYYGFLDERYIYVPVMLMYLVVGLGFERISQYIYIYTDSLSKFLYLTFFILFVVCGIQTIRENIKTEAYSSKLAGEWLANQSHLKEASLIANGEKIPFYARRNGNFVHAEFLGLAMLKEEAIKHKINLITIETRKSNLSEVPDFSGYHLAAKFEDLRHVSMVFRRNQ